MAHDTALGSWRPASRIAANSRANLKTIWGFTVFWNAVSAPVLVYVPAELQRNPIAGPEAGDLAQIDRELIRQPIDVREAHAALRSIG